MSEEEDVALPPVRWVETSYPAHALLGPHPGLFQPALSLAAFPLREMPASVEMNLPFTPPDVIEKP